MICTTTFRQYLLNVDNNFSHGQCFFQLEQGELSRWKIIQLLMGWNQNIHFIRGQASVFKGKLRSFCLLVTLHARFGLPLFALRFLWLLHYGVRQWSQECKRHMMLPDSFYNLIGCCTLHMLLCGAFEHLLPILKSTVRAWEPHRPDGFLVHGHHRAITPAYWLVGPTRLRRKKPAFQRLEQDYFLEYREYRSHRQYLFIPQIFTETLLCSRGHARCWG